jgi:hypothetical protein
MIQMLVNLESEPLVFIADIDIQPRPELCDAARYWLHKADMAPRTIQEKISAHLQECFGLLR